MKNNWSSVTHKYLLDESEFNIFSLAYRQLVNALEMLEKQQQIRNINTKLENAAITDYLTGLYNRDGFHSMVEKSIDEAKANNEPLDLSVLYIDLDNFKYYNDTFGHDIGDFILKSIANLLKESASDKGFAVRFGGDEFLIILKNVNADYSQQIAKTVLSSILEKRGYVEDISQLIHKTATIPDSKNVSASIGIAIAKDVRSHDDIAIALKQADSTLYQIKHTTKSDFKLATPK
jgi:diguanylate cyclase (GGDEF)-like protein